MTNLRSNIQWILLTIMLIIISNLIFIAAVFTPSPLEYAGVPFPINKEAGYVFSPLESIPNNLPTGRYYFRAVTTVSTQFKTFHIPWETETFLYDPGKK